MKRPKRIADYLEHIVQASSREMLIEKFISLVREVGHFPVVTEMRMKARADDSFPWSNSFSRFGSKQQFAAKIVNYCKDRTGYEDVVALCQPVAVKLEKFADPSRTDYGDSTKEGYVYLALLKLGREKRYKIGKAVLVERRKDQISIQLPEDFALVHSITTDDAYGIEEYWHRRFAAKKIRKGNGSPSLDRISMRSDDANPCNVELAQPLDRRPIHRTAAQSARTIIEGERARPSIVGRSVAAQRRSPVAKVGLEV